MSVTPLRGRKPATKLGTVTRKGKMSDLEKLFLSQQPFLQAYFNGCAKEMADRYIKDGAPALIRISVIPTWHEKIYNVMTEIIPEGAKTQEDTIRITRYIRFADLLQARGTITTLQQGTEEEILANTDKVKELLPDRLQKDFINVKKIAENGEELVVPMRQETVAALNWLDAMFERIQPEYKTLRDAELVRGDFSNIPDHVLMRVHYDPTTSPDLHVLKKSGWEGHPESLKNLGTLETRPVKEGLPFYDDLDMYAKAEVRRFVESNLNKAFGWEIVVIANAKSKGSQPGNQKFDS